MTPPLAVKEGWQMVPVELDDAAVYAMKGAHDRIEHDRDLFRDRPHHAVHSVGALYQEIHEAMLRSIPAAPAYPTPGEPTSQEYEAAFAAACIEHGFEHVACALPWEVLERFVKLLAERGRRMADDVLHWRDQSGQTYGSESRKCEHCGIMIWPAMQRGKTPTWTDDYSTWWEAKNSCRNQP